MASIEMSRSWNGLETY